ncbi:hypothetical protein LINGRAHAP2_LOCUS14239 [Linum grandiflorum]
MSHALALSCVGSAVAVSAHRQLNFGKSDTIRMQKQHQSKQTKIKRGKNANKVFATQRKDLPWKCVQGCGACCKLDKGPLFPTPEEIFTDSSDVELYRSLIGPDGWCIHYEKSTRKCSIYADRPYFCRVDENVFEDLYGINKKMFNREACNSCRDTIEMIYGFDSKELNNFNQSLDSGEVTNPSQIDGLLD